MTPKQLKEHFLTRDDNAVADFNMISYKTEGQRLTFLEGRVKDMCHVVLDLCDHIQKLEDELEKK